MSGGPLPARAFVFETRPGDATRSGRTRRCLEAVGLSVQSSGELSEATFRDLLQDGSPLLLMRAGAWFARPQHFQLPPSSATGKALCALGALRSPPESDPETQRAAQFWTEALAQSGGDFNTTALNLAQPLKSVRLATAFEKPTPSPSVSQPPQDLSRSESSPWLPPECLYFDPRAVTLLAQSPSPLPALRSGLSPAFRRIHFPALDVYDDPGLRILQVITALQRGGAERLTLDLLAELPAQNVRTRLATLGRPVREAFALPPRALELSRSGATMERRAAALVQAALEFGADLLHAHLIPGEAVRQLSQAGFPLVVTVHNLRAGWPEGLAELPAQPGVLLAACAQSVEADLRAAKLPLPLRTVWNGINFSDFTPTPARLETGRQWRRTWGFGPQDFVLCAIANPRPQKRLERLPAILAALRARLGTGREARLALCGEATPGNAEAERCVAQTRAEVTRLKLDPHVRWTGPVADIAGLLGAVDVLVSTSAHEGLSLAQLEALAMGRSVVTTDVGGARELAHDTVNLHLLPVDASADAFAEMLCKLPADGRTPNAQPAGQGAPELAASWSRQAMARRYRGLYPRVVASARRARPAQGLWLLTNNFSTGGAQSSARRLLLGLAAQGIPARAAVIEEHPAHPTPGRQALQAAGIPVLSVAAETLGSPAAVESLLAAIDADPPQAVLFWNLRPAFKVLLADALLDIPVFDVSPGEMFFDSLAKFFAKSHPGLPYRTPRNYGARLAGLIVKYRAEAAHAAATLGAPVHVVPNGVPLTSTAASASAPCAPLIIGTAARLNPHKRLEDLLEALRRAHSRLPSYRLQIAGGVERGCDHYASELRVLANGLPIDWLGETSDVASFHRGLDLFAMISEPAGCPNASLEAMAAGLPVIATSVGGAAEQVLDGQTGRLVPARAPDAFADALVELARQPGLRRQMGLAARDHIRHHFSLERMLADYRRILGL